MTEAQKRKIGYSFKKCKNLFTDKKVMEKYLKIKSQFMGFIWGILIKGKNF